MKKLIAFIAALFFTFAVFSQERELSDYEKYVLEKENQELVSAEVPDIITKVDTVYIETKEPTVINNYYIDSEPNLRHNIYFGYSWNYRPYYSGYYNPWHYGYGYGYPSYGAWYGGYYNYPYYGSYYPYYGYNWYGHNYYRPHYYSHNYYRNRRNSYYSPYTKTYRYGYITNPASRTAKSAIRTTKPVIVNRTVTIDRRTNKVVKNVPTKRTREATARIQTSKRTYRPSYTKPRTSHRNSYNRPSQRSRATTVTPQRTNRSSTYQRSTSSRSSSSYSRSSRSSSRNYSTPSRSTARSSSTYRSSSSPSRSSASYSRSSSSGRSSSGGSRSSGSRR